MAATAQMMEQHPALAAPGPEAARLMLQRLVFRCSGEVALDMVAIVMRRFGGELTAGFVYHAIDQATRALPASGAPGPSALAVAHSVGIPRETGRRQVLMLKHAGWIGDVAEGGYRATPSPQQRIGLAADAARMLAALSEAVGGLQALGYGPLADYPLEVLEGPSTEAVTARLQAFYLQAGEDSRIAHPKLGDALLFTALVLMNASDVARDPELAWRFASVSRPPPGGLMRPVSASEMAQRFAMPYPTARRRLERLVQTGRAERAGAGYVAVRAWQERPEMLRSSAVLNQHFEQMLASIRRAAGR